MEVIVRRALREELPILAEIAARYIYQGDFSKEEMTGWMKGELPFVQHFVAETGEEIIGFATWWLAERCENQQMLELTWIVVQPSYRRRGIARNLVTTSLAKVREFWKGKDQKIAAILVFVEEENRVSQAFFEKILVPDQKVLLPDIWGKGKNVIMYLKRF